MRYLILIFLLGIKLKIKIGNREHIASASFLVPPGDDVWIEFNAGTWPVKLNLVFVSDNKAPPEPNTSFVGKTDYAVITFTNWNNPFIGAFLRPMLIGESNNRKMVMFASGQLIGEVRSITLDFLWESANNG